MTFVFPLFAFSYGQVQTYRKVEKTAQQTLMHPSSTNYQHVASFSFLFKGIFLYPGLIRNTRLFLLKRLTPTEIVMGFWYGYYIPCAHPDT